jgi:uroporphyrinogen-III synthase
MRLIVTRPEEDAGMLVRKLAALGHAAVSVPLLAIVPREDVAIPERNWQAIAVTSANGIRALGFRPDLLPLRVLTVGPQSLAAAHAAGFLQAEAQGGDVEGLANYISERLDPRAGPILYLSGAETAGDLEGQLTAKGFAVVRVVLYDAVPAASLGGLSLSDYDGVLLYSPRTARIWVSLAEKDEAAQRLHYFCLSRNAAAALPAAWHRSIAATPDETAMMALLDRSKRTR